MRLLFVLFLAFELGSLSTQTSIGITSGGITGGGITSSGITSGGITGSGITSGGITSGGITGGGITGGGITSSVITGGGLTSSAIETTSQTTSAQNASGTASAANRDKVCNQLMQNVRSLRMLLTQFLTRYPNTDKFDSLVESAQDILSNTENICRINKLTPYNL